MILPDICTLLTDVRDQTTDNVPPLSRSTTRHQNDNATTSWSGFHYTHGRHNAATFARQTFDVTPFQTPFNDIRDDGIMVPILGTSIDVHNGTLRQDHCLDYCDERSTTYSSSPFCYGKGWEVNVHLLQTFTDSPDLTVERYCYPAWWTVLRGNPVHGPVPTRTVMNGTPPEDGRRRRLENSFDSFFHCFSVYFLIPNFVGTLQKL